MGLREITNYVIFDNPISSNITGASKYLISKTPLSTTAKPEIQIITKVMPLHELVKQQGPFLRIAGLMGASAVACGAYGTHKKYPKDQEEQLRKVAEIANRFHFINSMAMIAAPMCTYPTITGSLFLAGTVFFSGTCYYHAFTGENKFGKLAPFGGMCMIAAWLSLVV